VSFERFKQRSKHPRLKSSLRVKCGIKAVFVVSNIAPRRCWLLHTSAFGKTEPSRLIKIPETAKWDENPNYYKMWPPSLRNAAQLLSRLENNSPPKKEKPLG
jgi:hypothetical protein